MHAPIHWAITSPGKEIDFVRVCAQTSSQEKKDGTSFRVSEWNGSSWLLDGKVLRTVD